MENKKSVVAIILLVCAVLIIGALNIWASPCEGMLTTVDGKSIPMKCHYLIAVGNCIALLCMALAIHIFTKKEIPAVPVIVLGLISILITISGLFGIGICLKEGMACHTTASWMRIIGGVLILCGIYSLVDFDKQL